MTIGKFEPERAPAPGPFDFETGGGSGGGVGESPDGEMPESLKTHLLELEAWATANKKDAKNDAIAFWILKAPAIMTSVGSGLFAYFDLQVVALISGFVAGVCVVIDGIHPRGLLRNTHLRAYHDLRILTGDMMSSWRTRNSRAKNDNTAKRILKNADAERQRIAKYIKDAETSLDFKREA